VVIRSLESPGEILALMEASLRFRAHSGVGVGGDRLRILRHKKLEEELENKKPKSPKMTK
jgi:hypothetical protein